MIGQVFLCSALLGPGWLYSLASTFFTGLSPFYCFLFYLAFPTRKLRYDVCAAVRPPLQGTEGCARSTAVCFIPLHAGASTRRNNRYSAIWASCQVVARHIPPFVRIFPFRADGVMGKQ